MELTLNGRAANAYPDSVIKSSSLEKMGLACVGGCVPVGITINGLARQAVLPGCVFYLPLWHPILSHGSPVASLDKYGHSCVITGASWRLGGRYFDAVDDAVAVSDAASIQNLSSFTFEAWVKPVSAGEGNYGTLFAKGAGMEIRSYCYTLNRLYVRRKCATTTAESYIQNNTLPYGIWSHVCITFDSDKNFVIYVNAVDVSEWQTQGVGALSDDSGDLYLGNLSDASRTFDGIIGEVLLYSRALTAGEILCRYLATRWRFV